jgi:hypothetical protein
MLIGLTATALGQTGDEQGALTINFTSTNGLKMPRGRLSIKSNQGKVVYEAPAEGQAIVHLPYGRYSVAFEADWFEPVRRVVVVDKPDNFVQLGAVFDAPETGPLHVSISVKVEPATSCTADGSLWAKLVGVYSQEEMERRVVVPGGYALFEPVVSGSYVLIVVDGAKVRATLPIETTRLLTTATVSLSACQAN